MVIVAHNVNVVNDTDVYTSKWFKWLVLCYVYFTRKKLEKIKIVWAFWGQTGGRVEDRAGEIQ